jgi:hypothetical protein
MESLLHFSAFLAQRKEGGDKSGLFLPPPPGARVPGSGHHRLASPSVFSFSRDFPGILIVLITENEWDGKVVFVGF